MTLRARKAVGGDLGLDKDVEALVTPPRTAVGGRGRGRGRGAAAGAGEEGAVAAAAAAGTALVLPTGAVAKTAATAQTSDAGGVPAVPAVAQTPAIKVSSVSVGGSDTPSPGTPATTRTPTARTARVLRSSPSPLKAKIALPSSHDQDQRDTEQETRVTEGQALYGYEHGVRTDVERIASDAASPSAGSASELDDLLGAMGGMAIQGSPARLLHNAQQRGVHPQHFVTSTAEEQDDIRHGQGGASNRVDTPATTNKPASGMEQLYRSITDTSGTVSPHPSIGTDTPANTSASKPHVRAPDASTAATTTAPSKIFLKFTRPASDSTSTAAPAHFTPSSNSDTGPRAP